MRRFTPLDLSVHVDVDGPPGLHDVARMRTRGTIAVRVIRRWQRAVGGWRGSVVHVYMGKLGEWRKFLAPKYAAHRWRLVYSQTTVSMATRVLCADIMHGVAFDVPRNYVPARRQTRSRGSSSRAFLHG